MVRMPWATYLWPGLPQLWYGGLGSGLVLAVGFAVLLNALLLVQGSIWARATWGVWWDWDVRLTTSLVMLLLFAGVLALRSFVDDTDRRATWTAVATIVAFVDVPLVYFCVRWWRSLHQTQSTPETVSSAMVLPLRINAFAILFIAIWLITKRAKLERERLQKEHVDEPARVTADLEVADVLDAALNLSVYRFTNQIQYILF